MNSLIVCLAFCYMIILIICIMKCNMYSIVLHEQRAVPCSSPSILSTFSIIFQTWQTRYILLLWLSMICMIPFDLIKFDGADRGENKSVIDRILDIAKVFFCFSSEPSYQLSLAIHDF